MSALRVALLAAPAARALAPALAAAGQRPEIVRGAGLPAAPLRLRKLGEDLERVPLAALAVRLRGFDVAHAFTPSAALAAAWGRPRAAVLTFPEPVRRERLADRRLRLATLERALAGSAAVVAPDDAVAASLWRWLGVKAAVLRPDDGAGHAALYAELLHLESGAP